MLHPATAYASIQSCCRGNEHSFSLTLFFSKQKKKKNGRINETQGGKVQHKRYSDTPIMHRRQEKHLITSLYKMSDIPRELMTTNISYTRVQLQRDNSACSPG